MGAGESRFLDVSPAAHRTLLRPLAIFEKCQKRRLPPHSITARHTGSHGKHRNHVTTWSYRSTDLPDRARSGHPAASGAKIFVTQAWRAQPDFLSRFNKSTRRANHPKVCKAPFAKIF